MNWMKSRLKERTSWDGIALVAMGVIALVFKPLIGIAAWAAIVWGAYTIWKSQ
jgi:hypothetical protein